MDILDFHFFFNLSMFHNWPFILTTDNGHPMRKIGPMWQEKYALAVPNNLGLGLNFWPCSEGFFLSGRPKPVNFD